MAEFRYVYYSADYDASVAFYRDVLRAQQVDGWDGGADNRGAIFAVGAGIVEVIAAPGPAYAGGLDETRRALAGRPDRGWLLVEVDDADALHDELSARGAAVVEPPRDMPWGHRDFGVVEPGGLTLFFFSAA